jgi:hypothetical protein
LLSTILAAEGLTGPNNAATASPIQVFGTAGLSVTVSGSAQEGRTLTANPSGSVTGYQWQELIGGAWTDISGATSQTYVVQETDEALQIRVHVTSSSGSADSAATSAVTDIAPTLTAPVISGTAQEGQTLTATMAVANDSDATVAYQWKESFNGGTTWQSISGGNSLSYVITSTDLGAQLEIVATSTDSDGSGTTATSAATASATSGLSVTVSGSAQEGRTLTANPSGSVTGYQWQELIGGAWTDISGATSQTYVVRETDEALQIRVHVTSSSGSADSAATSAVTDIAPTVTTPVISGTAQEGQTLTASATAGQADTAVTYQWFSSADGFTNPIGSGASYQVKEGDEGSQLKVVATATNDNGVATSVSSAPIGSAIDVTPTLSVVLSGDPVEGSTLTATPALGTDGDNSAADVSYRWERNGSAISGATGSTYVVGEADEGAQITVVASLTDDTG